MAVKRAWNVTVYWPGRQDDEPFMTVNVWDFTEDVAKRRVLRELGGPWRAIVTKVERMPTTRSSWIVEDEIRRRRAQRVCKVELVGKAGV